MKIAVCVKYVPVVAQLRFDPVTKTLVRDGVASEINPFDRLGLACAVALRTDPADEVIALCMGPPQGREGLRHCLALGADRAILLADRALAGSDTLATARALALVLERERPDVIVCGRNSTDAETGQVGPELAELLGWPHISQARALRYDAVQRQLVAERVTDAGYQVVTCALPALVCVTEGIAPERYALPPELEAAQHKPLEELDCAQLSADLSQVGRAGSPTWVEELRPVVSNRLGTVLTGVSPEVAAQQVATYLQERLQALSAQDALSPAQAASPRYAGQQQQSIWVVAEVVRGQLRQVTREMLGAARALTATTQSEVVAVLLEAREQRLVQDLAAAGADRICVLEHPPAAPVWSRALSYTLAEAIRVAAPYAVLCAATTAGRDLAARLAAKLQLGLTGDAIGLEINSHGQLIALKPAVGGQIIAPIGSRTRPTLVTLRPGMLPSLVPDTTAPYTVDVLPFVPWTGAECSLLEEHTSEQTDAVALTQAQVVLGVGMGLGGPENLPRVQGLAAQLGAVLATTRNVVHSGWLPHQLQVGISGRTIAPRVYLAVGIRGAFNHTVGMQNAGVVLALNRNPRAAIFKAADYGIVGEWQTYLPPLVEALQPIVAALGAV